MLQFDSAQLKLVYHALKERATLLQNAPHLTWPLPTLVPCYDWRELPYSWAGLKLYDLIAGPNTIHPSRFVTANEAHSLIPTLSTKTSGLAHAAAAISALSFLHWAATSQARIVFSSSWQQGLPLL